MHKSAKKPSKLIWTVLLSLLVPAMVSGCAIQSGAKTFEKNVTEDTSPAPGASEKLAKAFATTSEEGKKFHFSGWAGTKVQKRMNAYYFTGTYDTDKGYSLDARIFGQPFRYYRWGDDIYLSEEDKWRKIEPSQAPLAPFRDFEKLTPYADKAFKGADENILGSECDQYIIPLNSDEAFKVADTMGINILADENSPETQYLKDANTKLHIWVGKKDNFIYKYLTETTMPIPGAGSIYQEVSVLFWKYNNAGITLPGPEKLKPYLLDDDEA